jgi:hypothetical protein
MRHLKSIFIITLLAALALQACNLPEGVDPNAPDFNLTVTANAALIETALASGELPPEAQGLPGTEDPALPLTEEVVIPAAVLPPAVGDVTVTVSVSTNCRQGPGTAFASVYGMPVGQVAKVVAKNSYSGYWIIEIPGQNGKTCWLWGQYATINGDTASLKDVVTPTSAATQKPTATKTAIASATATATSTATATPTATTGAVVTKPNAPVITSSSVVCTDQNDGTYKYEVTLQWTDNSNNETGFEIALNPAANNGQTTAYGLGPDVTGFIHTAIFPSGTPFTSSVFAQNSAGNSSSSSATVVCP